MNLRRWQSSKTMPLGLKLKQLQFWALIVDTMIANFRKKIASSKNNQQWCYSPCLRKCQFVSMAHEYFKLQRCKELQKFHSCLKMNINIWTFKCSKHISYSSTCEHCIIRKDFTNCCSDGDFKLEWGCMHWNMYNAKKNYFKSNCCLSLSKDVQWGHFWTCSNYWHFLSICAIHTCIKFEASSNLYKVLVLAPNYHQIHSQWLYCEGPNVPSTH